MSIPALDYSKIFNRLCHVVVLTKENRQDQCLDNLILTLFAIDTEFAPSSVDAIADALIEYFGLPLSHSAIGLSLA